MCFDLHSPWRQHFPGLLQLAADGQTWLDSAATAQKPHILLDALQQWYSGGVANVHRAQHLPAERATAAFEQARQTLARWLNAESVNSVVFTRGSTEGINLLAHSLAGSFQPGDEILIGAHEHHANLLPWQQLAKRQQLSLRILPLTADGALDLEAGLELLGPHTRLLAISPLSNVLGRLHELTPLLERARQLDVLTVVDAAQYAVHRRPDVQQLDADFLVCSAHKLYGPEGIGLLYAHPRRHALLQPWQWGGEMIDHCDYHNASARPLPLGLEAGTPNIGGVLAFAAVIDWLHSLDTQAVQAHEQALHQQLLQGLQARGMQILGSPDTALACFNAPGIHSADLAMLLGEQGIAVRAGQHCAMPLLQSLGVNGAVRVSLGLYNDSGDLQRLFTALDAALEILA